LTLVATVAVCAEQAERAAVVQELLARSRLLEDIHFRVPRALWEQYLQETFQPQKGLPAPVAAVPEEGVYSLALPASRKPLLTATLRLRVLDPERSGNLPVFSAAWAWEDIQVNGQPAKLATVDGWLRLSPAAPGECVVTGRLPLREATPAGGSLRLEIPQLVRTFVGFDSPEAWEVAVDGHFARLRGEAAGGTHGQLALTPRNRLSLTYERPGIVTEHPPRYALRGSVAWNLDPAAQQVTAVLDIGIIGGSTERLELGLPASAERLAISGPDVRETQVAGGRATVFLRGRTAERTRLRVACEMPLAKSGTQRLDGLSLEDGHWAGGTLVITSTAGSSEVLAGSMAGLRQLALADIPPSARATLAGPPALAYEISARTWSAEVEVLDLGEFALRESIADLAHYQLAFQDDGTIVCRASYEMRNRTRQFLRLELPAGALVAQARVNDDSKPLSPVPDTRDTYLVPLVRSTASVKGLVTFPVEVVFLCRIPGLAKRGEASLPLPRIDLPIAYAWCEVYVPKGMEVSRWTGPLKQVQKYSNETASASLGYGLGLAAEGYKPTARPEPAAKPAPKPEAKPEEKKPRPKPTPPPPAQPPPSVPASYLQLVRNYYRAGKEFYEKGDYVSATESLERVLRDFPNSPDAPNAMRLLGNIKLMQGNREAAEELKSQAQKAAGVQVTKEAQISLQPLQQRQQEMIERGLEAARQGREQEAKAQLSAAESLSGQLIGQGANRPEQDALMRAARDRLGKLREREQAQATELQKQVQELKGKGQFEEAIKKARQLQQYDVGGKGELAAEMQQLAVEAAKQKTVELGYRGLANRLDELAKRVAEQKRELALHRIQKPERDEELAVLDFDRSLLSWPRPFYGQAPREQDVRRAIAHLEKLDAEQRQKLSLHEAPKVAARPKTPGERGRDLGADYARQRGVALETQKTELSNLLAHARALYGNGDFVGAVEAFTRVGARAKYLAPDLDTSKIAEEAELHIQKAMSKLEDRKDKDEAARRPRAEEEAQRLVGQQRLVLRGDLIQALDRQARVLFDEGRYDEARKVCDDILRKDPGNALAKTLREVAVDAARKQAVDERLKDGRAETEKTWAETRAFSTELGMRSDELARRRPGTTTPVEREAKEEIWAARINDALQTAKVSFDFDKKPLQDVVAHLGTVSGLNIVLDPEAVRDGPLDVTLRVKDMPLQSALNWTLKLAGLKYTLKDGAIFISAPERLYEKPVLRMYEVTDLTIDITKFEGRQQALAGDSGYATTGRVRSEHEAVFTPAAPSLAGGPEAPSRRRRPIVVFDDKEARPQWEERIREALNKKVSFDFAETPLEDVVAFLSNLADVAMVVDWSAVGKERPNVTLRVNEMRLADALSWIVKLTGVTYVLKDEAVFITKPDSLTEKVVLRIYDVVGLVQEFQRAKPRQRGEELVTGEALAEFVKKVIAPGTWDERGDVLGYTAEYRTGKLLVVHTPEVQDQVAQLLANLQKAPTQEEQPEWAIRRTYDVRELVRGSEEEGKKLEKVVREAAGAEGQPPYTIQYRNGRIVVVHAPEVHVQIERLMETFRAARGPQVQRGQQFALQQARGVGQGWQQEVSGGEVYYPDRWLRDDNFRQFVGRNYKWAEAPAQEGTERAKDLVGDLSEKLELNLGQKVQVNSINLGVAAPAARDLGVSFVAGKNGVTYAVVDEGQLRTLLELDAARRAKGPAVTANPNAQETIVGTDALVANGMVANVRYAADFDNTLDLNGNPIQLSHAKYVVIDNGSYLTAIQANPMQHWAEAANPFPFAAAPQEIEVPRVGALVKFEKTLVEPGDELVLKASYRYSR
jgi:tetratricopeptide (TPR) repeat protein